MKTSTLLSMALVSVSCYAAPLHTSDTDGSANGTAAMRAALRANAAPVAPPAPDIAAQDIDHARWRHVPLPKSRAPSRGMASRTVQVQT
ncbi:hypothetical protein BGLT_04417 [Caballeronia glathei]|jgi:hypothetical protein|uniref:Lipoprotein n=1 Tax=Caballeronia glathei TaxID=60547 RepID=A0A069PPG2_9BURK|nr:MULTISPECIES: hypothetical protein [Burkholderiaceae]KDR39156.1 hypothetical protein BG61_34600 [Caballeronia glathei]TCK43787.1 hypothetical protein B0G84_2129 [Paraburkholderia sp. BL8N3]CDY75518.1 hypothetical protein BGLT_04417 [Caballeronia glathei]